MNLILMSALVRSTLLRFGSKLLRIGRGREDDDEVPQRSPYRLRRNSNLRNASYGDDLLNGSSSLDTIGLQRPPSPCFTLQRNDGLRSTSDDDDTLIGGSSSALHMIFSGVPYPSSTALQSNGDLSNALFMTSPIDK